MTNNNDKSISGFRLAFLMHTGGVFFVSTVNLVIWLFDPRKTSLLFMIVGCVGSWAVSWTLFWLLRWLWLRLKSRGNAA